MPQRNFLLTIVLFAASLASLSAQVQVPALCPGDPKPSNSCQDACVSCQFFSYTGINDTFYPSPAPGFCGTVSNNMWFGFVAGAAQGEFVLEATNCYVGDGMQLALYDDCEAAPIACIAGQQGGAAQVLNLSATLVPGKTYFLMVDGYNGDICDFTLTAIPPAAGSAPGVGTVGNLQGPASLCPGAMMEYSLPADVPGAGYYEWTAPPGWLINGQGNGPLVLPAPAGKTVTVIAGATSGQLKVRPFNACNSGTAAVKNIQIAPIPPTILPSITIYPDDLPYLLSFGELATGAGIYETALVSALGCDSVVRQKVIVSPGADASGNVYADLNNNNIQDGNDFGLANVVVSTSSGKMTTTNSSGRYSFSSLPVGDTIRPTINISGVTIDPAFYINQTGLESYLDFAVQGTGGDPDMQLALSTNTVFRPGFQTKIFLQVKNRSLNTQTNVALHALIPAFLEILDINPAFSYTTGDTMHWDFGTFQPGEMQTVVITINTNVATPLGTSVVLSGWVSPLNDLDPANNVQTRTYSVAGSYDPNDKQVDPAFITPAMLANRQKLYYTIRFQNTGNYPADQVRIVDTIQSTLEPASFELLSSSHPCTWSLKNNGILEFLFPNINLPDSVSNEPESHGFVQFSLRPRPGLFIGDLVENFCDIYFDFNLPVRTNTAGMQVVTFLPNDPPTGTSMDVRPNPASYVIHFGWSPALEEAGVLQLYTLFGLPVASATVAAGSIGTDLYIADQPPGTYIAVLESGMRRQVKTVLIQRPGGPVRRMRK